MINYESILLVASRTPSGDNIQPWFFKVEDESKKISIFHDHKLAFHSFNPEDIASSISFGMMLFLIEEEALRQNYEMKYVVNEEAITNVDEAFIVCTFSENTSERKALFSSEVVLKRRIGRGAYQKQAIPVKKLEQFLSELNSENDLMNFSFSEKLSNTSVADMKNMEHAFWNKKHCLQDIFKWVHFTSSSYYKTKRGFHRKELCVNPSELSFIYLIKNMTGFSIWLFNVFAYLLVFNKFNQSLVNANFTMLSLKRRPTVSEWLLVGKSVMKYWLKMTEEGMVVQPMSIQSFFISFSEWGICKDKWPSDILESLKMNLKSDFKIKSGYMPFWMYRIGYPHKRDTTFKSVRLSLDEMKKV
ncbi:MAG: hypothetical protein K2Q18_10645 [Bdellovibrionales bacterium]|nr:hypothetical protein [Bdellovibrionales bacterium]